MIISNFNKSAQVSFNYKSLHNLGDLYKILSVFSVQSTFT